MEREDDAAGAQLDAFGDHRQRRLEHGRIGIEASQQREVPLGHPDTREAVAIAVLGGFHDDRVLVRLGRLRARGEEHHAALELRSCTLHHASPVA